MSLADLELAFEDTPSGASSYLDLKTGQVITLTDDIRRELDELYAEVFPNGENAEADPAALEAALEQRRLPEWMRQAIREADLVEAGFGTRYIRVPEADSREAYRDMEAFIETVTDARLQSRLWDSIRGQGPFRRFKAALATRDREREQWYAFRDARLRQRILEWLDSEGIEPRLEAG